MIEMGFEHRQRDSKAQGLECQEDVRNLEKAGVKSVQWEGSGDANWLVRKEENQAKLRWQRAS